MENWAKSKGHQITSSLMYEDSASPDIFPKQDDFDWLVVMGGPMGCYDEDELPWLAKEKLFIKETIDQDKVVLGICLGAQLIAEVMGGKVYKGEHSEIGWHLGKLTNAGLKSPFLSEFPKEVYVLQWHGDTFDLPSGAQNLISGERYPNQGFSYGENLVGLQFHLEFCAKCVDRLCQGVGGELTASESVMNEKTILAKEDLFLASEMLLQRFLNNLERS